MKLNYECVRDLMLELEEKLTFDGYLLLQDIEKLDTYEKYGKENTLYSILKLIEGGYLEGNPLFADGGLYYLSVSSITWDGHELLNSIRSNEIWGKTKEKVKQIPGVSLDILLEIAKDFIRQKLFG